MNPLKDAKHGVEALADAEADKPADSATGCAPVSVPGPSASAPVSMIGSKISPEDGQLEWQLENADGSLNNQQLRYLNAHSTCAMCDSRLEIKHDVNKGELKVKEEAHCPSCGIRVRSNHHLMH